MHSLSLAGECSPFVTQRAVVLAIALVSRVVCLFFVSQWPRYFHTYHTNSSLLHLDVPELQDRASWRTATGSEGIAGPTWNPAQHTAAQWGHRWCKQSCQEPGASLDLTFEESSREFTKQSTHLPSRNGRPAALLPVILPVNVDGMQMLASAPLHDTHVQTFLAVSDMQKCVSRNIPLTSRRPRSLCVPPDRCPPGDKVGRRGERLTSSRLSGGRATQAEKLNTDGWLWRLVVPLLSWDAEYFVACAMQGTKYFYEMTHAFFPGLSLTYIALKELLWPAAESALPRSSPVGVRGSIFVRVGRALPDAFLLSDSTLYGLIGVILSNITFILATLGVFEVALSFMSSRNGEAPQAATAGYNVGSNEVYEGTGCAPRDPPSVPVRRIVGAGRHWRVSSSPYSQAQRVIIFKEPTRTPDKLGTSRSSPTANTQPDKRERQMVYFESSCSQMGSTSIARWTAFWYAFSGANVHMSAAYTESFFACLSTWGLVLLLRAEEFLDHAGKTKCSEVATAKSRRAQQMVHWATAENGTQYESDGTQRTTHRGDALHSVDLPTRTLLPDCSEGTLHAHKTGFVTHACRYCFSWAATVLFCSAALLRSNGSLSLIPLFFHTLRTCPGVRGVRARFSSESVVRGQEADGGVCVVSTVRDSSAVFKSHFCFSVVKRVVAVVVHWVNALLQATVVLSASFVVLAYPYYLYCACPHKFIPVHLHSDARSEISSNEDYHCQVISRFLGQPYPVQPSPACKGPCTIAQTSEFVQTNKSSLFSVPLSSAGDSIPTQPIPSPPSFVTFAQSFVRGGLPYSLRTLTSSITALQFVGRGLGFVHSLHPPTFGSPEGGYSEQHHNFDREASSGDSIQHSLQSGSNQLRAAYTPPAWCANSVPNVYPSVQREYWGVEFLGFLRVETLYLIIMCLPFYAVSVLCVIDLLARRRTPLKKFHDTTQKMCFHPTQSQKWRTAEEQRRKRSSSVKTKARLYCEGLFLFLLEGETGHVVQLVVLSIVMLFFAHTNVFVRLSTACPIYFLQMARLHTTYMEAIKRAHENRLSRRRFWASSAVNPIVQTESSSVHEPSDSGFGQGPGQSLQLSGGNWWEWCSAFVLMHHFLGPLLFSCYITWT